MHGLHGGNAMSQQRIVSARTLEELGILKRRTALRMAQLGMLPHVRFGAKLKGVGFFQDEVIEALKKGLIGMTVGDEMPAPRRPAPHSQDLAKVIG